MRYSLIKIFRSFHKLEIVSDFNLIDNNFMITDSKATESNVAIFFMKSSAFRL